MRSEEGGFASFEVGGEQEPRAWSIEHRGAFGHGTMDGKNWNTGIVE